jgi:diguanylate cyclase (GGDEF)-like protein
MTAAATPWRLAGKDARVLALAGVLAAFAALLYGFLLDGDAAIDGRAAGVGLALPIIFAVAEICVVHVHLSTEATSFSLSEIALVLGLVYASPGQVVAARLIGGVLALVFHRRQRWMKLTFNLADFALEACVAILVHRALLGDANPLSPHGVAAALVAALAALAVGSVAVSLAISAIEGRWPRGVLSGFLGIGTFTTSAAATVGLVGAAALRAGEAVPALLAVVGAGAFAAYSAHARLRQDHSSLALIHDFTRTVGEELDAPRLNLLLLRELSDLLRADAIQLVLRAADAPGPDLVLTSEAGHLEQLTGSAAQRVIDHHDRLLQGHTSVLVPRQPRSTAAADRTLPEGLRDAVVTVLPGAIGPAGSLLAGNRRGDVDTFGSAEERLLTTLANHVTIVLQNADLVARLRREAAEREHASLHDGLTGLGNREMLDRSLRRVLVDRVPDGIVAVLLIDLDRFKEVNDTLGHHQGDVLLREIARRLVRVVGDRAVAIRLGGDEFAVLTHTCATQDDVLALAHVVEASITAPFELGDVTLDVGASIGVSMSPDDGDDPETLLQRADVAMYAAKSGPRSIELYDAATDHYSPWRLALASELRRTIERRELLVEYQPKADLRTGAIVGAEALARWHHPERGFVPPDEFVPVAEHTGLIRALTEHVLDVALGQCRAWRDGGHDLHVAVNLSVRNLVDEQLPQIVAAQLDAHGVPASALTLEVTEGTIMADPTRTVGILNRLSSMGVTISVDDFGTGYSSLGYLKRLPVDELKIDRSFVASMVQDDSDAVIVRSTIDLARNLGLVVTAEGVEDAATWQLLRGLGCNLAQGYYLGKPMTAARFGKWLREREADEEASLTDLAQLAARPALDADADPRPALPPVVRPPRP